MRMSGSIPKVSRANVIALASAVVSGWTLKQQNKQHKRVRRERGNGHELEAEHVRAQSGEV